MRLTPLSSSFNPHIALFLPRMYPTLIILPVPDLRSMPLEVSVRKLHQIADLDHLRVLHQFFEVIFRVNHLTAAD